MGRVHLCVIFLALILVGCAPAGPALRVADAWARPSTTAAGVAGAFMTLINEGNQADRLIGARTDAAEAVELHETVVENDVMRMRPVPAIVVPARGRVELKPGGYHIMLIGLRRDLPAGERLSLVLEFERAGEVAVEAEVRVP